MVVHPEQLGLYFIGLVQPWGSIMPLAERQSEWVADIIDGAVGLPSREEMQLQIERTQRKMHKRYADSRRHTIQVDFYSYLDELDREFRKGRRRTERSVRVSSKRRAA